ncbi:hypothetical protein Pedsa_0002 [Pseudopedobacter saltans DSM 12145]|uniref:Photosynthesis system II assembly factor Ycf48/Hcf136-like domain-containing protein n=1 Tax=Pseudopedobacter saltans (strain ATCC 51119 / DSM 12145 / JCM 21818 / CCUG 39354 / LMG 10337 / NBRC 100064 / NCIMB 13643) TaxID=762903 RepID=F0SBF1_PSESL|nr:YCF48-related protein [Pseudopedobacter saltans]ADY50591.1 hypothetical protein Pedsa_0002 [Pseudopedobacter saltans DSM 12145]
MYKPLLNLNLFYCFLAIGLASVSCDDRELIEDADTEIVSDTVANNGNIESPTENGFVEFSEENAESKIWEVIKWNTSDFTSVYFVNQQTGYICGENGIILKTTDGGKTYLNLNSGTNQYLYHIKFINDLTGYAVGNNKTILKTTNGGNTWSAINVSFYEDFRSVYFVNEEMGFITGSNGIILRTSDSGKTWLRVYSGTYGEGVYGMCFLDNKKGYASGRGGLILKTIDGGISWNAQPNLPFLDEQHILTFIHFTDKDNGYIVGGIPTGYNGSSVLLRTFNGGESWQRVQLPISIDYLTAIKFADKNVGYIIGGQVINNTSVILKTIDGGSNWTKENVNSSRQYGLDIIGNNVFSVGMDGTILKW